MATKVKATKDNLLELVEAVQHSCILCRGVNGEKASIELRCKGKIHGRRCGKLLAETVSPPYKLRCGRCGYVNEHV